MKILLLMILSISLWANIGNIMAMKGSAKIQRANSSLNATNGMVIEEKDKILTGTKSRVQVMLKDSTVVTIGANSSFSFDEFKFDGSSNSKLSMSATRGFFRSVTGKIGKIAPERFRVKTVTASIGIRGTDFSGEINPKSELFKCYEGRIFVEFDGSTNDIDSGMMMEIRENKYEIKEFDTAKNEDSSLENKEAQKESLKDNLEESEIATEVIADITQAVENTSNEQENNDDSLPRQEPFEITPNTEDRQIGY